MYLKHVEVRVNQSVLCDHPTTDSTKRDLETDNWQLQSKGFNIDTEGSICIMDVSVSKR